MLVIVVPLEEGPTSILLLDNAPAVLTHEPCLLPLLLLIFLILSLLLLDIVLLLLEELLTIPIELVLWWPLRTSRSISVLHIWSKGALLHFPCELFLLLLELELG